jgi:ornithine cyclodeaminase/alanine dehydrogenase-like protein (mu-crystallin family)
VIRIPVFAAADIERAVSAEAALSAVRDAFVAHHQGAWTMPPKLYVTNYPAGDFRAMPALGHGHALLKWVSSFPANPAKGLPTVSGAVLLSNAETGELEAVLDAAAVTALRTGAAAVLAAETLGRGDAETAAVIGAGVNGAAAARMFLAHGRHVSLFDLDRERAARVAERLGASVADSLEGALAADLLVTVTPAREPLLGYGSLQPGQHVSLMGADGPGKAEIAREELERRSVWPARDPEHRSGGPADAGSTRTGQPQPRVRLFCDDWEQASHSGDIARVVESGQVTHEDVTELGAVLAGARPGRQASGDITIFDSTGLAIQDLAIAIACVEAAPELDVRTFDL